MLIFSRLELKLLPLCLIAGRRYLYLIAARLQFQALGKLGLVKNPYRGVRGLRLDPEVSLDFR